MPPKQLLKEYRNMGGYIITLGSDAHKAENASGNFEEAICTIKEFGFKRLFYFKNRNCCELPLN